MFVTGTLCPTVHSMCESYRMLSTTCPKQLLTRYLLLPHHAY